MELKAKHLNGIWEWKYKNSVQALLHDAMKRNDVEAMAILGSYQLTKSKFYIEKFFEYCGDKTLSIWRMI